MKELTLIPIIIIILIYIFRYHISHIIDSISSGMQRKIQNINYGQNYHMLYAY